MVALVGLIDVRIMIYKLLYLSYFISDFDQVCGILHELIRACLSGSHAYKVAVPFKVIRLQRSGIDTIKYHT